MKRFLALTSVFLVLGCSGKPASTTIAEGAKETISTAYSTLPKECQTETVKKLTVVAQTQVDSVVTACDTEKAVLEKEKTTLRVVIGVLLVALAAILWKKF